MNFSTSLAPCNLPDCHSPGVCPWKRVKFMWKTWFRNCSVFGWRQPEGQVMDNTVPSLFSAFFSPLSVPRKDWRVKECLFFLLAKAGWCLWVDCTASVHASEHEQGRMTLLRRPNIAFAYICFVKLFVFPLKCIVKKHMTVAWQTLKEIMCCSHNLHNLSLWRAAMHHLWQSHLLLSLKTCIFLVCVGYIQAAVLCNWSPDPIFSNYFVFSLF